MNGAQALMKTLADAGVDVCFTNPGTSEMHFVAALDSEPRMRAVLALFEGRGHRRGRRLRAHGRQARRHAAAPGLRPGQRPGEPAQRAQGQGAGAQHRRRPRHHARALRPRSCSPTSRRWRATSRRASCAPRAARRLVPRCRRGDHAGGLPGQVATLILPADVSWGDGARPARRRRCRARGGRRRHVAAVAAAVRARGKGSPAARRPRPARAFPARRRAHRRAQRRHPLLAEVFPTRMERGAGLPAVERIAYLAEMAGVQLAGYRASDPGRRQGAGVLLRLPGQEERSGARRLHGAHARRAHAGCAASLEKLAAALGAAQAQPALQPRSGRPAARPAHRAQGCKAVGHLLPANAIPSTRPSPRA